MRAGGVQLSELCCSCCRMTVSILSDVCRQVHSVPLLLLDFRNPEVNTDCVSKPSETTISTEERIEPKMLKKTV